MSFDLSWLWNLLNSLTSTLNSWFSGIWTQVSNIVNTGQGIFAGLVAFGSQVWDAITKMATTLGEWLGQAYDYIRQGLENLASTLGNALNTAFAFIGQAFAWFGSQLYNLGNWLYNSMLYIWNWMVNMVTSAWNNLATWFSGMATNIQSWWATVSSTMNSWFSNIITTFRTKIIQTIQADLTISMAWKSAERLAMPHSAWDIGGGLMGLFSAPIVARLVSSIIDAVIPIASSTPYPLVPSLTGFSYTPPSMTVTKPEEKAPPSPIVAGVPTPPFIPVEDFTESITLELEYRVDAGTDMTNSISTSYEISVA